MAGQRGAHRAPPARLRAAPPQARGGCQRTSTTPGTARGEQGDLAKKYNKPADPKGIARLERALGARGHRVFFGAWDRGNLDRAKLGLAERILARRFLPEGDWRDWREIEAWATGIARALQALPARR